MNEQLLSRSDVAKLMNVCVATVQRMTARGELPVLRFNNRNLRYRLSDVERFIEQACGRPRTDAPLTGVCARR